MAPGAQPIATVPCGVLLRVALERRLAIKRVGEPIRGRLVDPVYVYDRVVLPAAILSDNFAPSIAAAVTGLSFHQDYNAHGVPDQDILGRAESGAVGLALIGAVLAQVSRTFLARGEGVVLPANTPVKISLRSRGGETGRGQPVK
jgi:hypothetical protein